ncbi:hypothetical protein ACHWQZ_G005905 [Mnemiopsis leidyi]
MAEPPTQLPGHPATPPLDFSWNKGGDVFLGLVLTLCTLLGTPANVMAIRFFLKHYKTSSSRSNKQFFNGVYVLITLNDLLVSLTLFPVFVSLFLDRDKVLFSHSWFCGTWAVLWEIIPFYSVYLVGFLSFTRLTTLLNPNTTLPLYTIPLSTVLYIVVLAGCKGGAVALHYLQHSSSSCCHTPHKVFNFNTHSMYCFIFTRGFDDNDSWFMYSISSTVLMAGPIPLILTSCLVSLYKIRQATLRSKSLSSSVEMQRQASITIVIVTLVYLVYNIPVFLNYIAYTFASFHTDLEYRDMYGSSPALYYYAWVTSYVVCVALNALTNPVVYFLRMSAYRRFVLSEVGVKLMSGEETQSNSGYSSTKKEPLNLNKVINTAVRGQRL